MPSAAAMATAEFKSGKDVAPSGPLLSRLMPLRLIDRSPTNPRKHFDEKKLAELLASVREDGVVQPLIVRAQGDRFELVCGERRLRAATLAGHAEIPVIVRALSDADAFRLQLSENIDRDDLTPYEEAEAFGKLFAETHSVAEVAKIVRRRTPEVASRLALLTLPNKVREALGSGLLPLAHAELIGTIPDPKLQEAALGRMLYDVSDGDKPLVTAVPYVEARRIVEREFRTDLALAIFDPEDADLSPLGPCSRCMHLAGNNRDLFGDVKKNRNVCTNPRDFQLKTENHLRRLRDAGHTVLLTKKELKEAFPFETNPHHVAPEFIDLERACDRDPKLRTYDELLGRAEKLKTVYAFVHGRVRKLYRKSDMKNALVSSGHSFAKERRTAAKQGKASQGPERRVAAAIASALVTEVSAKLRTAKFPHARFTELLLKAVILADGWKVKYVVGRHGYAGTEEEFAKDPDRILVDLVAGMTEIEKRAFALDLIVSDFHQPPASKAQQAFHKELVKLLGIDAIALAKQTRDGAKETTAKSTQRGPAQKRQTTGTKKTMSKRR